MSSGSKMVLTLLILGIISGGSLALVYGQAQPSIERNRQKVLEEAIFTVIPGAVDYRRSQSDGLVVYSGLSSDGSTVGLAVPVEANGFQSTIKMMVGLDAQASKITGMVVLEDLETPGLGARISETEFRKQFAGLSALSDIVAVRNRRADKAKNEVEAITGATISSQAVAAGISRRLAELRGRAK